RRLLPVSARDPGAPQGRGTAGKLRAGAAPGARLGRGRRRRGHRPRVLSAGKLGSPFRRSQARRVPGPQGFLNRKTEKMFDIKAWAEYIVEWAAKDPYGFLTTVILALTPLFVISAALSWKLAK
uniref:Small integral membrane protein 15 n=1 Tax=Taeniopygia guttata TaxID=59729 RepID=A0A674H635_TAEGU